MRIPVITGPTAVGKTQLSVALALEANCEIVSADSRQIYRELEIGTAKPGPEELARVPHHLISERSIRDHYSAGAFAREAELRMSEILARGGTPLVVGGSTLYLSALQFGLSPIPPVPPEVRRRVTQRLMREGAQAAYRRLLAVDPAAATELDPTNTQRLVRALEVYETTGKPLSHFHRERIPPSFSYHTIVLTRERAELYARIDARTDEMLRAGLVEEVRDLLAGGIDPSLNALQTIGYREVVPYLQGAYGFEEMRMLLKRNTRRYAKRQLTWFRRFAHYQQLHLPQTVAAIREAFARHDALPTDRHDDAPTHVGE